MTLVTRGGDGGWTRDPSGRLVSKDDPLIEALGALDHLVCALGWLAVACHESERALVVRWQELTSEQIGAICGVASCGENSLGELERDIERLLPCPPSGFVLPGGGEAACRAHLARVACRTAERTVVRAMGHACPCIPFLNRLSDALFALAVFLAGGRDGPDP